MALLGGVLWILRFSSLFRINSFQFLQKTPPEHSPLTLPLPPPDDLVALLQKSLRNAGWWQKLWGAQHFFSWPARYPASLLPPEFTSIAAEKHYKDHVLYLVVARRIPRAVWCFHTAPVPWCGWIDENGVLFRKALRADGNLIATIDDYAQRQRPIGSTVLPRRIFSNLLSVLRVLHASPFSEYEIALRSVAKEEVEVNIPHGPRLLFSLRFPADGLEEVLRAAFYHEGAFARAGKLQYLDFRVKDRVYYQ
ncbi:hypothetical protein D6779_01230 [Candidatus Parcubacteria bacterium]|nr:MAG: hypothetical protein D6779_01230 [Candidatus Parcubacteria bacterium]